MSDKQIQKFAWLDDLLGLIFSVREGDPTYAGNYKTVYFPTFKTLAYKQNGTWKLASKVFPLDYRGGAYGMAKALGL